MRTHILSLSIIPLFAASGLPAQTNALKLCISQDAKGYDALRLARELSSRRLEGGISLTVVAITEKLLSADDEQVLGFTSATPFARVLFTEKTAKAQSAQLEQLGCDYGIKVWYHESADNFDTNSPAGLPGPFPGPTIPLSGDRTTVTYELRKAGSRKIVARASAPPLTVYVRQGRRVFNPYQLLANQIVKKLDIANSQPH